MPRVASETRGGFPLAPLFPEATKVALENITELDQLLQFQRAIPLELTEQAVVGEVTDLLRLDSEWWVLDKLTFSLFKYDDNGRLLKVIGAKGAGPGEFQRPRRLDLCFDNLIGVMDPGKQSIALFTRDGVFVRQTKGRYDGKTIFPNSEFYWPEENRLYISGYYSHAPTAPLHVVLDEAAQPPKIAFGFGQRYEVVQKAILKGGVTRSHSAFACIDGRIWSGSPYSTDLEIFTLNGEFLTRLGQDIPRDEKDYIGKADLEALSTAADPVKYLDETLSHKFGNFFLIPFGDTVISIVGTLADLYDRHGNLLRPNLKIVNLDSKWQAAAGNIIQYYVQGMPLEMIRDPQAREAIEKLNLSGDFNPVLLEYAPIPLLMPEQPPIQAQE